MDDDDEFFSDSVLQFLRGEEDFEDVDYLFSQIPDWVLATATDSARCSSSEEPQPRPSEFRRTNSSELWQLIAKNNNRNTKPSTNTWVRRYSKWVAERGLETNLARVPKADLDGILQQFYAELLKKEWPGIWAWVP